MSGREDPGTADGLGAAMGQLGEAWAAPLKMWSAYADAWQSMLRNRGVPAWGAMMRQAANPAAFSEGVAPLLQEMLEAFSLPRLADLPLPEPGALPSPAPAMELLAVAQQYMLSTATVWIEACRRFQAEIAERRRDDGGEGMDSAGEALDVWNNVLDHTLMEFNRSAEFAAVQQRFLRAAMQQRQELRKLGEGLAKVVDMPTRSEMDDVYRRLHDLLRAVHELRREVRALKGSQA